ncbi:heterokaryon incompatibility protein-domain-containing protein [Trametes polyzona]|nr:heterokaryon incompatibility protein-domain-containing protein [Trametes polyzona]
MYFRSQQSHRVSRVKYRAWTTQDDPAADFVPNDGVLRILSWRDAISVVRKCKDICLHEHRSCRMVSPQYDSECLPTRLVDCRDPLRPRLLKTADRKEAYSYVALSYVWGADGQRRQYCTTTKNVSDYMDGIDPQHLPQTIRDAIQVTRDLGFDYLWVDGLCIIQDSNEDKHLEIGRMRHIYRRSSLTIIAARARDVDQGFLQDLPPPPPLHPTHTLPFICPRRSSDPSNHTPCQTPRIGTVYLTQEDSPGPRPEAEPIDLRAWCLQEFLMSPRTLIFSSKTIVFGCQTTKMNVGGAFHEGFFDPNRLPDKLFLPKFVPAPRSREWKAIWENWWQVVGHYGWRSTSFPSDRLVACGGLAEEFQRALNSDYLAGLWRETLLRDLLWFKNRESVSLPRPAVYRAPSWSWAAVDVGQITLFQGILCDPWEGIKELAEVVSCTVELKDAGMSFGEVVGGSLVLRVLGLLPCTWQTHEDRRSDLMDQHPPESLGVSNAGPGGLGRHVHPTTGQPQRYVGYGELDSEEDADVSPFWAVPLLPTKDGFYWGLLLARAAPERASGYSEPERGMQVYRRVGAGSIAPPLIEDLGWDKGCSPSMEIVII